MAKKKKVDPSLEYDAVFNPWMGCAPVDSTCNSCHYQNVMHRERIPKEKRRVSEMSTWNGVAKLNRKLKAYHFGKDNNHKVIRVGKGMDLFEDHSRIASTRMRFFKSAFQFDRITYLVCTKRPENVMEMWPKLRRGFKKYENVMIGISVHDQESYDRAVPHALAMQDKGIQVYLSAEPLLEVIDMNGSGFVPVFVVVGGEVAWAFEHDKVRPLSVDGVRVIKTYCTANSVPFFFKQLGNNLAHSYGISGSGKHFKTYPQGLNFLKVRELPRFKLLAGRVKE